ncbi:MAG TPA: DUF1259 domain-containing protein [Terriglobia bacterium]|nr:DUF1259 domain-containing protein [Terriglobia bacterium]
MLPTKRIIVGLVLLGLPTFAVAQGLDTAKLDQVFGRSGQKLGQVYKFSFPRTDLHVTVHGVAIRPGLALGSWAAFSGKDNSATVMGDLVLLQDEVNPVMTRLRHAGMEITAVHNHLLGETPRLMYLHYMGRGNPVELAKSLRSALRESKTPFGKPATATKAGDPPAFVNQVEAALGRKGNFAGGVLAFSIPRADAVTITEGETVLPSQGVAESINFQQAGEGKVATTGDFVLTADEVNPAISALEAHHIQVTALHSHMLIEQPRLFFMHFWGYGPAAQAADGTKAALEKVHTK